MNAKFIKIVESGNLASVRYCIANELLLDPRGKSFSEMKEFAESKFSNLYDIDDAKTYSSVKTEWNEDFLFSIENDLDDNFSKEKLAIYEDVAKFVLRDKAEQLNKEEASRSSSVNAGRVQKNNKKKLSIGITVGGAAVAVTGLCLSRLALASLGFAGVVIGGILLYNDAKK
jgi:hypothetical protein